jgi:hypothetical protein
LAIRSEPNDRSEILEAVDIGEFVDVLNDRQETGRPY